MTGIISTLRRALIATILTTGAYAYAQQARGVNPADIDSRFDAIVKRIRLDPIGTTDSPPCPASSATRAISATHRSR